VDPKDKKIVVSRDITFDEVSMMKPASSQQVESGQTKKVSQRLESDATPRNLGNLVSFELSHKETHDGDHVADKDTGDVENKGPEMG